MRIITITDSKQGYRMSYERTPITLFGLSVKQLLLVPCLVVGAWVLMALLLSV